MPEHLNPPTDFVRLGKLGKTFQLEGGLRVYPEGDAEATALLSVAQVFIGGMGLSEVRQVREVGSRIVLYLTRALSVEAAKALVNREVYAHPDSLPEPEEGEIYVSDLLDQPVFVAGSVYGEIVDVVAAGMQDLLVISRHGEEIMVPLQAPYVEVTDDGVYLENAPEGLLEF